MCVCLLSLPNEINDYIFSYVLYLLVDDDDDDDEEESFQLINSS